MKAVAKEDREYLSHAEVVAEFDGILARMGENGCSLDDINVVFSIFLQHVIVWNLLDEDMRDKVLDECEREILKSLNHHD